MRKIVKRVHHRGKPTYIVPQLFNFLKSKGLSDEKAMEALSKKVCGSCYFCPRFTEKHKNSIGAPCFNLGRRVRLLRSGEFLETYKGEECKLAPCEEWNQGGHGTSYVWNTEINQWEKIEGGNDENESK